MRGFAKTALVTLLPMFGCASDADPTAMPSTRADANPSGGPNDAGEPTNQCTAGNASELRDCVDPSALTADIERFSVDRVPGTASWQEVQDTCSERLSALGYQVQVQDYGSGKNLIATRDGTSSEQILVSAHYDHIENCPGAADNAAGIAVVLEAARVFAHTNPEKTIVFALWDEEERGLLGAEAFVAQHVAEPSSPQIQVAISIDAFGYTDDAPGSQSLPTGFDLLFPQTAQKVEDRDKRGDFLAVFGDQGASTMIAAIEQHAQSSSLPAISLTLSEALKLSPLTSDLRRSDHAPFWEENIPAIHLTDTANFRNPNYHCLDGTDSPDTVDTDFVVRGTQALVGAVAEQAL